MIFRSLEAAKVSRSRRTVAARAAQPVNVFASVRRAVAALTVDERTRRSGILSFVTPQNAAGGTTTVRNSDRGIQ